MAKKNGDCDSFRFFFNTLRWSVGYGSCSVLPPLYPKGRPDSSDE